MRMTPLSIRSLPLVLPTFLGLMLAAPSAARSEERGGAHSGARAAIRDVHNAEVGFARMKQLAGGEVRVSLRARGLTPGLHGFHVHTKGICDPRAVDPATGRRVPFFSAGGHYDPRGTAHGHHAGDMPVLFASTDGRAAAEFATDRFTVRELLAGDGSAIVIHGMADNFAHIPDRYTHPADSTGTSGPDTKTEATGDAGGRTACGVVRPE